MKHTLVTILAAVIAGGAAAQEPSGAALFATNCAACHGADGEGGGPVASVMSITVPNLRTIAARNGSFRADDVASFIDGRTPRAAHGGRTMPVWGDLLNTGDAPPAEEESLVRARIAALVSFIERLQYR